MNTKGSVFRKEGMCSAYIFVRFALVQYKHNNIRAHSKPTEFSEKTPMYFNGLWIKPSAGGKCYSSIAVSGTVIPESLSHGHLCGGM